MSPFAAFLDSLFEDGHVPVPEIQPLSETDLSAANTALVNFEKLYRLELPGKLPEFEVTLAEQAAILFYRACQFTVSRDTPAEQIDSEFLQFHKLPDTPEAHYAVDLVFRFLPDLFRLSRSAMQNDPLLKHLGEWAVRWPLSSVGLKEVVTPVCIDGFVNSPGLLRLYCDRIIEHTDLTRLDDPRVRTLVEASWGMYPELAPRIHNHFQDEIKQNDGSVNNN